MVCVLRSVPCRGAGARPPQSLRHPLPCTLSAGPWGHCELERRSEPMRPCPVGPLFICRSVNCVLFSRPFLTGTHTWSCGKRPGLRGRWIPRTSRWPVMRTQVRWAWAVVSCPRALPRTLAPFASPPVVLRSHLFLQRPRPQPQPGRLLGWVESSFLPAAHPWGPVGANLSLSLVKGAPSFLSLMAWPLFPQCPGHSAPFLVGLSILPGRKLFRPGWQLQILAGPGM